MDQAGLELRGLPAPLSRLCTTTPSLFKTNKQTHNQPMVIFPRENSARRGGRKGGASDCLEPNGGLPQCGAYDGLLCMFLEKHRNILH